MAGPRPKVGMFREVNVLHANSRWKSISINTGASASSLQDIKVPESCGGFSYCDSGSSGVSVRNRFIYWRTYQDVLELVEESLDTSLCGNCVRYRFQDTPVLPHISIYEAHGSMVILLSTVASVHRLVFPHPRKLQGQHTYVVSEHTAPSIFYSASLPTSPHNQFLLTPGGSITSHFLSCHSSLPLDGHALFCLATNTGGVVVVKMPPVGVEGVIIQQELSCSSVMKKLWNGLVPGVMRSGHLVSETVLSLQLVTLLDDIYIFCVCRDLKLRVWSVKTRDCILTENLLDFTSEEMSDAVPAVSNASGHVIKTVLGSPTSDLCVYLCLQHRAQFVFLRPEVEGGRLRVRHQTTLERSPPDDLVDYVVTEAFLMTLWTTQAGDTQVLTSPRRPDHGEGVASDWQTVPLAPTQDTLALPPSRDAREVYVDTIFSPLLFCPQDIVKALSVYRRCPAPTMEVESLYSSAALKEEVIRAIDAEMRNLSEENELQEEEYTRLEHEQWEKFYCCCQQYKQVGEKAKGLFADPVTGLFAIIKKSTFSLLRPCDKTEELYLSPTAQLSHTYIDRQGLAPEGMSVAQFSEEVRSVCDCLQQISAHLSDDSPLPSSPLHGQSVLQASHSEEQISQMLDALATDLLSDHDLVRSITSKLACVSAPVAAIEVLFNLLEVTDEADDVDMMDVGGGHSSHYQGLYSGALGTQVLTVSLQQLACLRYQCVRDLSVLLCLVTSMQDESGLSQPQHDSLTTESQPKAIYLMRCYQLLLWASSSLSADSPNNILDSNLRQLSSLDIIDGNSRRMTPRPSTQSWYLSQLFIEGVGGDLCRQRLVEGGGGGAGGGVWLEDLLQFVHTLATVIWPATDETVFPEFLVRACQYLRLQEYVHILSPWCAWNESSRAFFLGLSYLHFDENHKALSQFVCASEGLATETFLSQKLLQTEEPDYYKLQILYYLKIIKLLEEKGLSDLVITMATEAINKAEENDPNLPTLQSKVFKEHLTLGHCAESFTAMMNNPDVDRKKDCLRQFLVVLCETGELGQLVAFDYGDLETEVVAVLEARARGLDLYTHDYYSLLYSFHIYREDYRAAGRVMLERAQRLSAEVPGLKSLQEQAQCYLAAFNSLQLVRPENAWIVRPVTGVAQGQGHGKRDVQGEVKSTAGCRKLEILELSDLKKEYLLLDSRLRLIRHQPDTALVSGPQPAPEEILSLLCSTGLYDTAMSVISAFSLTPDPLLSSLALRCVTLSLSVSTYSKVTDTEQCDMSWRWLKENSVPPCGVADNSPSDQAWRLLHKYMDLLEDGSSSTHKCVATTLLSQSFHLPTWLIHSYKKLDLSSLLRLYLHYDMIPQASALCVEYIEAVTDVLKGLDSPAFQLKGLTSASALKVWLPYTCIDQLFAILGEEVNPEYVMMHRTLKEKFHCYQEKSSSLCRGISAY